MFVRKSHWNVRNTLHRKKPPTGASELLTGAVLYIASLFRKVPIQKGFNYANKFNRNIASDLLILLPTNKNNEIDYEKK